MFWSRSVPWVFIVHRTLRPHPPPVPAVLTGTRLDCAAQTTVNGAILGISANHWTPRQQQVKLSLMMKNVKSDFWSICFFFQVYVKLAIIAGTHQYPLTHPPPTPVTGATPVHAPPDTTVTTVCAPSVLSPSFQSSWFWTPATLCNCLLCSCYSVSIVNTCFL